MEAAVPAPFVYIMVVAFVLHNAEEAFRIETWAKRCLQPSMARWYGTAAFVVAVSLLSIAFAAIAIWAVTTSDDLAYRLLALAWAAIYSNALLHSASCVLSSNPMPGGWTAVLIILPLGCWSFYQAIDQALLSPYMALILFGTGALLQVPIALLAIVIGNVIIAIYKLWSKDGVHGRR
ncbi:HXXEE domain-containing protein [Agrobacterium vitis]|uniref:HXXEE domain-containing protein n=1 Tax=Agrobacterium vitis TaxID=373 RepID=A0A368NJ30_AGRVI|nr:HXXEE domain-containing protein [Agrobacterium vitis]KAA3511832.1 HXXEE domain-containing protein [Agrobacterium vitis]KAA3525277.1 HXXEE domain-containing protein [Agrobacterium vitis]MCF1479264.1 HXXEE domain-containing protein [Agrobacterium vitis]MUZ97647.1 HXXEE domain-containing protein [Agrobacterium vitis]MVA30374.1 HXXEE domain-containing protein [Agrobacterium vitis]